MAAEEGVEAAESELIGLAPLAAFLDVADHAGAPADASVEERLAAAAAAIRLRDFSPLMALELRLQAARGEL
jgi:glutamate formiminotransferase